jgi:salicylate 1-O-methyltransferase
MALDRGDFGYRPLLEGIAAELDDMVTEGVITGDEARRMTIPTVGRSEADLTLPFAPKNRFSGLTIEDLEVLVVEDPYWARYEKDRDADSFAAGWTAFGRSSVFPTLATSLEDPRAGKFVDRLSAGVQARLAAAPEPFRLPLAKLLVVKQAWPR